ncbi:tetratricopeptide repeat protein [Halanaerobium saccharolyticum]|uniref:Tetratricopeptide repeat protein n=1 Tax=Halanaerobium saccharolyticum TaxID=43595 RepID=A0A4R6RI86_9FIRM|nr:tetratricopeptide repeat protein [Halanaerobium saccharolyticum]TDP86153.1 tetratricopeptide repeat protein [Halanaerobium saccharolyticum]
MKKKLLILIIISLLTILFNSTTAAESKYNWEQLINTTQKQLKENESDIVLNYTLAVAYANTGEIKNAYDIIDVFGSSVSREDFNTAVSPYLADWENYQDSDNLLLLNYAAFREVINKDYREAVSLFEYIFKIDPENLWALNHAAAALIEIKQYDQALNYADQALSMQENEYSHLIKGYVYYENGNYFRAVMEAASARNLFKALASEEYQDFAE